MDLRNLLLALAGAAALAATSAPEGERVPSELRDWHPKLDVERVEWLIADGLENPDHLKPRQADRFYASLASLWDARLFLTYCKLVDRIGAKERDGLRSDQAKWLKLRGKAVEAAGREEGSGSLSSTTQALKRIEWTRRRDEELSTLFASVEAKPQPAPAPVSGKRRLAARTHDELRDWRPVIDVKEVEQIVTTERDKATGEAQHLVNRCAGAIASLWDARLFVTYRQLSERVSSTEAARLRQEQASWLKERDEAAFSAFAAVDEETAPMEESLARVDWTEKRNVELWARLLALEKKAAGKRAE